MNALIVDDHEIIRDGMALLLQEAFPIQSILFAADGREALQKITNYPIDLVILDLSMPDGLDGLHTLEEMRKLLPDGKIIIFSMYDEIDYKRKAYNLGADGYLVKRIRSRAIIEAIQQVLKGVKVGFENMEEKKSDTHLWDTPFSKREMETFILTVKGYSQKEIAETMNISIRTVENHRRNISKKIGTTNKKDWLDYARKHKILEIY